MIDYSRAIEKRDIPKIEALYRIVSNHATNKSNYWDKVKRLTKNVKSDHSLSRWQCLAEYYENEIKS